MTDEEFAPAKLNLFLRVTGKRDDGYHVLDSLVVFPPVGDRVLGARADGLSLMIDGPFAGGLAVADNLVLCAARALADAAGLAPRAALRLTKNLPVAAGLGGGSADAAAALRLLNRLWRLHWPAERLIAVAGALGADVPMCLASLPARAAGIGHDLFPAPALPPLGLLLANPGVALATPDVFRARTGGFSAPAVLPAGWADAAAMARDLAALGNDLEPPAIALQPAIADLLAAIRALPGCLLARMSGSGATCFGLFAPDAPPAPPAAPWCRWSVLPAHPAAG